MQAVELDVTSDPSVQQAVEAVRQHTVQLDVLVNNAGISSDLTKQPSNIPLDAFDPVFATNYYGIIRTTQAFPPLLRLAPEACIVNLSSSLGSLTLQADPSFVHYTVKPLAYCTSKAMVDTWTIFLAYELRDTKIKVNAVNPGFTATDFTGHNGTQSADYAAQIVAKYAILPADGPTGQFFSEDGPTPW